MSSNAFEIVRGDDATITVRVLDENDAAIDLTDYQIFFTAKKSIHDSDSDAALSKQVNGESDGNVDINFTAAETTLLKPRSYFWDIQLEKDGVVTSTVKQLFRILADVTRRTIEDVS